MAARPGERLTVVGLNGRLVEMDRRISSLEVAREQAAKDHQGFQLADAALQHADSDTARAVDKLAEAINDPKTGLIVELANFRVEVRNDRKVFKAYVAGAVAVLSAIWAVLLVFAPAIQKAIGID